ncbi:unnamed protein product, partial [Prorocentrum cordatum]
RRRLDSNGHGGGEDGRAEHVETIGVGGASAEKTASLEPRPGLSDEQRARIESNRLLAQQRKQQQLLRQQEQSAAATVVEPAAAPEISAEQREARIEQNRALAAERRRLQQLRAQSALGAQGESDVGAALLGPVAVDVVECEGTAAQGGLQGHSTENCSTSVPSSTEDSDDSEDSSAESSSDESTMSTGSVASSCPSAAGSACSAENLGASSDSEEGCANSDAAQSASESGELAKPRAACTQPQLRLSGAQRQRILQNQQLALKKQSLREARPRRASGRAQCWASANLLPGSCPRWGDVRKHCRRESEQPSRSWWPRCCAAGGTCCPPGRPWTLTRRQRCGPGAAGACPWRPSSTSQRSTSMAGRRCSP